MLQNIDCVVKAQKRLKSIVFSGETNHGSRLEDADYLIRDLEQALRKMEI